MVQKFHHRMVDVAELLDDVVVEKAVEDRVAARGGNSDEMTDHEAEHKVLCDKTISG